jgi:hypothetical protein
MAVRNEKMEDLLYILLLAAVWLVLVKVVFPKLGIHG